MIFAHDRLQSLLNIDAVGVVLFVNRQHAEHSRIHFTTHLLLDVGFVLFNPLTHRLDIDGLRLAMGERPRHVLLFSVLFLRLRLVIADRRIQQGFVLLEIFIGHRVLQNHVVCLDDALQFLVLVGPSYCFGLSLGTIVGRAARTATRHDGRRI